MRRNRLVTVLTALAVAWASLWPLVSSAHALLAGTDVPMCHEAGQVVPMDQAPSGLPDGEPKVHCPLCVMAFYAGFQPPPVAAQPGMGDFGVRLEAHCAAVPARTAVALPQGRAPPLLP